jgi:hypothetical protein
MSKRNNWVSASDVSRAAYCPHYLELKHKGTKPSQEAEAARNKGEASHDKLNREANDTRCYIATYLYGTNDPRTNLLRDFRDSSLMKSACGRRAVAIYYSVSPRLVVLSKNHPSLHGFFKRAVGFIIKLLELRKRND